MESHLCALKKLYLNPITKCYQYYILILNSSVAQIVDVILLKGVVYLVEDYPLQLVDIVDLKFEVRGHVSMICKYAIYPEDPENPHSEYVMEQAIRIPHPRIGIPSWHWMPKDERPEEGEYWNSRGVGYDLSGFVKTKKAGERILAMVHEVLGTTECKNILGLQTK